MKSTSWWVTVLYAAAAGGLAAGAHALPSPYGAEVAPVVLALLGAIAHRTGLPATGSS